VHQINVAVRATDPLSRAGLAGIFRSRPEFAVLPPAELSNAAVYVISADKVTTPVIAMLRRSAAISGAPAVLIIVDIDDSELLSAVENGVVAVLPRSALTIRRLAHTVSTVASSRGVVPPHLVGKAFKRLEQAQYDELNADRSGHSALTSRETDVLRLMADGMDTAQVAAQLRCSQRTVKNVIHRLMQRFNARNRSHAVAHALRRGMIQ
jgi:DNA-binding NarL/FixJ family response regulator